MESLRGSNMEIILEDENISTARLWVLEFFPPTQLFMLERALKKNNWDKLRLRELNWDNQELLQNSRSGRGMDIWSIATLQQKGTEYIRGEIITELPSDFEVIKLWNIQVGGSLSVVLADFRLSEVAARKINDSWRSELRPGEDEVECLADSSELHDSARRWLGKKLPGFFSQAKEPQPLLDLVIFEKFDPTALPQSQELLKQAIERVRALRMLGMDYSDPRQLTSTDLPKLVLSRLKVSNEPLRSSRTWRLWGQRDAIIDAWGTENCQINVDYQIGEEVSRKIRSFFVMIGIAEFTVLTKKQYADFRDSAIQFSKFSIKSVRELREKFLRLSLNLSAVRTDIKIFQQRMLSEEVKFIYTDNPLIVSSPKENDASPTDFNKRVRKWQNNSLETLSQVDQDYRNILSTVTSLGASAASYKLARIAAMVAFTSLVVATLLSELSGNSLLGFVWDVVRGWFVQSQDLPPVPIPTS